MRQIARLRSRALDDLGVLLEHAVEFPDQWRNFDREFTFETLRIAIAHPTEGGAQRA